MKCWMLLFESILSMLSLWEVWKFLKKCMKGMWECIVVVWLMRVRLWYFCMVEEYNMVKLV